MSFNVDFHTLVHRKVLDKNDKTEYIFLTSCVRHVYPFIARDAIWHHPKYRTEYLEICTLLDIYQYYTDYEHIDLSIRM